MELPRYIFKNEDALKQIATEGEKRDGFLAVSNVTSVDFHGGIFVNYEGAEYPQKGLSTPEILFHVNIMKAVFMEVFNLRPKLNTVLECFNRISHKILSSHFLKNEYRTAGTLELQHIICNFLKKIGATDRLALRTGETLSHLIEYDNAYRLRLIDIASETTPDVLVDNPRREINRLLEIIYKREIQFKDVRKKFKYVAFVLKMGLLIPKWRRAFKETIRESDWRKMQYDNTDKYWACLRTDYDFMGMNYEARLRLLSNNGLREPVQRKIKI